MVAKKISLIIPVYNKEGFLDTCLQSVIDQSIDKDSIEVILIDDGSTDGSLAICKKFVESHSFARVIEKENGGASSARNAGIRAATGELIAFLDADDSLNGCALQEIWSTFERYADEVDVVTTHLTYHRANDVVDSHKRYTWLKDTGLYDLAEYPYIAQTTMNIAVRNRKDAPILFNEDMVEGEDQLFVTTNLLRKGKIAYCAEAEYIYVRHPNSIASTFNNPLYCFDDMSKLFQFFLDSAGSNTSMAEYCRQILLYNVAWRLKGSKLFPTFAVGEKRDELELKLTRIMDAIPAESYCRSPYLSRWHKTYLLKRYGLIEEDSRISISGKKSTISFPSTGYTWKTTPPRLDFIRFLRRDGGFQVTVRLASPLFLLDDATPKLAAKIGGTWQNLKLTSSTYDYRQSHEKTGKFYIASFEIPIKQLGEDPKVSFRFVSALGKADQLKVVLDPSVKALRTNSAVFDEIWRFRDFEVHQEGKSIVFNKLTAREKCKRALSLFTRDRELFDQRARMKRAVGRFAGKDVWLYSDLPSNASSSGNALAQMLHDLDQNDGVLRYYVCNLENDIVCRHPELKGMVVGCGTEEHIVLALAASKILASYWERWTYFPDAEVLEKFGDYCRDKQIVYLQHGVLHAHIPWVLGWDRNPFDYMVVSSQAEYDALVGDYSYPEESLLTTGAPRTDRLFSARSKKSRKIALIPSWRSYLVSGKGEDLTPVYEKFKSSSFYRGFIEFIQLVADGGVLERYGYQLDVKLHPNFRCYRDYFNLDVPGVNVLFDDIDKAEYAIAITDFSSYIYDFVYAGARVMYFLPDEAEFRAGLHRYGNLEIPFADGFGPYANNAGEAVSALVGILDDLRADIPSAYQSGADGFFLHGDGHACDRLYHALIDLRE